MSELFGGKITYIVGNGSIVEGAVKAPSLPAF